MKRPTHEVRFLIASVVVFLSITCGSQTVSLKRGSNLRKSATTSSEVLSTVKQGDQVNLISSKKRSGYFHVRKSDGTVGWIWAKNVVAPSVDTAVSGVATSESIKPASKGAFTQTCSTPLYPVAAPAPIDLTACSADGKGGGEATQNDAKNNFCPSSTANPVTISEMVDLQKQVEQDGTIPFGNRSTHPLTDQPGPATDRLKLVSLGEGREVVLTGYIKIARQEGAESVNCGKGPSSPVPDKPQYHDIHISIVQNLGDSECSGVVAEMIPHHRPSPWSSNLVNLVAQKHLAVRVTGQMMFDSSHSPCVDGVAVASGNAHDPARASLWEVHPIYKFEVCGSGDCDSGDGWVPIESWNH